MNRRNFMKTTAGSAAALSLARCGIQSRVKRPNILFCIADDISYPHTGAHGTDWVKTPAFDRVAREGVLFTNAYTPNAKCSPSRASILTGRNSWQLEDAANHWFYFPKKFKTFPEVLSERGYHTGFTGKGLAPAVVDEVDGVKREVTGKPYQEIKTEPPAKEMSNIDYAANFEQFLSDKKQDQPFCFWYGGFEPHRAYEYRAGVDKGGLKTDSIDRVPEFWPDNEQVRYDMLDYAFEIEYFDQHLGRILDALEKAGELENTLIIVTADNGMPFPRAKGQAYEYSNHMPMAMMWKGKIDAGRQVDDFISFIDFAPTFLELADVPVHGTGMQAIEGKSLLSLLKSSKNGKIDRDRNYVLIGKERHDIGRPGDVGYPMRGIVKDGYLFVINFEPDRWPGGNPETGYLNCDGSPTKTAVLDSRFKSDERKYWELCFGKRVSEELYHIKEDPECMNNLAGQKSLSALRKELKDLLEKELKAQNDPRMFGNGDVFDAYPYMDVSNRNFYERYMKGEKIPAGWVNQSDFRGK